MKPYEAGLKAFREANQIDQNIPTVLHDETTDKYISIPSRLIYGNNYEKALNNPWCGAPHTLKEMADMHRKPAKSV